MKQTSFRAALVSVVFALLGSTSIAARAQQGGINPYACGPLNPPGQYGPFDYRTAPSDVKHRVEDYHFTAEIESLRKGNTAAQAGADLDYTLRVFPNNPRALLAAGRYGIKMKSERASGLRFLVECYFERAVRFMPNDPMVHVMYANYLKDRKRNAEAKSQLDEAEQVRGEPSDFDLDYNLGLLYYDVGMYDKSLDAAKRAYALGAPLPALMNKLKASGKWTQ
jgi:tetratricopeptide (TPR) repeat protein